MGRLDGKVAVVTGGSKGIGYAIAYAFADEGATVAIISRNAEDLEAAARSINVSVKSPGRAVAYVADVSDEAAVVQAVSAVADEHGAIHLLANCAGVSHSADYKFTELQYDEFSRIMRTNIDSVMLVTREVLKRMSEGYILNILTVGIYSKSSGVYPASKFAAKSLQDALVKEYKGSKIRISSISPGPVNTNIWSHKKAAVPDSKKEKMLKPSDIADIAMYLVTLPENIYIDNITVEPWKSIHD